jgi:hypothetical protein
MYAQVKANIDKLDKKGKQRILQLLQKSVAAPEQKPTAGGAAPAGAGAMGAMAGQLAKGGAAEPNTMANTPVSKTNKAKPGNPNAAPVAKPGASPAAGGTGFGFDGNTGQPFQSQADRDASDAADKAAKVAPAAPTAAPTPSGEPVAPAPKKRAPPKKKAAPSQAEIDAERERIMGPTSDSIIRTRPMMAESFSLFRKR